MASATRAAKRQSELLELVSDPALSAKSAGLRYVTDTQPGIGRLRRGKAFRYVGADGKTVRDAETLRRIQSLVIPPAWEKVWICSIANGHLQATGRDAKGRKQSRYHPRWRAVRDETKYERMALFGRALPKIREQVEHDLSLPEMPRERVLATIVKLMERTFIRVGNAEYARGNHSYGLTTMRNKHVAVAGSTIQFNFTGKSGVQHAINLTDRRLARIVKRSRDLPGYELFQYLDKDGNTHSIDSSDVNAYLGGITQQHFTAKDFRTWAGSVLAHTMLREFEPFDSESQAKRNVVSAIKAVAKQLGNTPTVCRKCYVHPLVIESYLGGEMMQALEHTVSAEIDQDEAGLQAEERALMRLLHQRFERAK